MARPVAHHQSSSTDADGSESRKTTSINQKVTAPSSSSSRPWSILHIMLISIGLGIVVCVLCSFYMIHLTAANEVATTTLDGSLHSKSKNDFQQDSIQNNSATSRQNDNEKSALLLTSQDSFSELAGLNCSAYGGPLQKEASEMVYWRNIPADSKFVSPFHKAERQYMTFEPDGGGWNNIRYDFVCIVVM
jgi:hypothetical protein